MYEFNPLLEFNFQRRNDAETNNTGGNGLDGCTCEELLGLIRQLQEQIRTLKQCTCTPIVGGVGTDVVRGETEQTVNIKFDPDIFEIDSLNRLTLKHGVELVRKDALYWEDLNINYDNPIQPYWEDLENPYENPLQPNWENPQNL